MQAAWASGAGAGIGFAGASKASRKPAPLAGLTGAPAGSNPRRLRRAPQLPVGKPGVDLVRPVSASAVLPIPAVPPITEMTTVPPASAKLIQQGAERAQLGLQPAEAPDHPGQLARHRQLQGARGSRLPARAGHSGHGQADPPRSPGSP